MYEKVKQNAPGIYPPSKEEQLELLKELVKIAKENGIVIKGCYEGEFLSAVDVDCRGCQTKETIENAIGQKLDVPNRKTLVEPAIVCLGKTLVHIILVCTFANIVMLMLTKILF